MNTPINFSDRGVRAGLLALTAAVLVTAATWHPFAANGPGAAAPAGVTAQAPAMARSIAGGRDSYADVVKTVAPAVVTIKTEGRARIAPTGFDDQDDWFRQFFGQQFGGGQRGRQMPQSPRQAPRQSGLGSGVIVSTDGYILTNNHVIDNADAIHVDLTDGRTLDAKVIGTDKPSDLAVLKINATDLHPLALGNSDAVEVGDVVLAVGNPLGLGQTVTMGIISAKGRSMDSESYEDFLQTDAPINHGNSGGALVSTKGELIGINSQIASVSDGNIGIGFAIPTNMAKRVMEELKSGGRVHRAQLGVSIQPVTSDIASSLGLKQASGVIVLGVNPGSAAERAGVKQNDVIKAFNGQPVQDLNALRNRVAESTPGSNATLQVIRDGSERTLSVKLDELQPSKSTSNAAPSGREDTSSLGVSVAPLTPELADRNNIPRNVKGILVQGVSPDGRAAAAGIQPGDVIQQVNRQAVATVEELRSAVRQTSDRPALLLVNRDGRDLFITVRPS